LLFDLSRNVSSVASPAAALAAWRGVSVWLSFTVFIIGNRLPFLGCVMAFVVHADITLTIFRLDDCTRLGAFLVPGHATVSGIMEMAFHTVGRCESYSDDGHFQGARLFAFITGSIVEAGMEGCDEFITTCIFLPDNLSSYV
jgi:hypothetical protein